MVVSITFLVCYGTPVGAYFKAKACGWRKYKGSQLLQEQNMSLNDTYVSPEDDPDNFNTDN
jgi:hypothetical protein